MQECPIAGIWPDHVVWIGFKKMFENGALLIECQRIRRCGGEFVPEVADPAGREFFNLLNQHRGNVDGAPKSWHLLDHGNHVEVPFGRVEADPRHQRRPADRIHIGRLVHVPQQGDVEWHTVFLGGKARARLEFRAGILRLLQAASD